MACQSQLKLASAGELYYGKVYNDDLLVPCGRCVPCKKRRVNDWVFRMKQEDKVSSSSFFITLTYDRKHVPITFNKFMTLQQKDFQNFMKRLRKLTTNKLRYYAVGEYGEENKRPHYHIILFNLEDVDLIPKAWTCPISKKLIGNVHAGKVTGASISYTTKYIDKEKRIPQHKNDDRLKEFSNMSQGLGKSYLSPQIINYHKADLHRLYVCEPNGKKVALPRYYREKIYTERERTIQNNFIPLEMEKNEEIQKINHYKKYKEEDYSYYTFKANKVLGEYSKYYHNKNRKL